MGTGQGVTLLNTRHYLMAWFSFKISSECMDKGLSPLCVVLWRDSVLETQGTRKKVGSYNDASMTK